MGLARDWTGGDEGRSIVLFFICSLGNQHQLPCRLSALQVFVGLLGFLEWVDVFDAQFEFL